MAGKSDGWRTANPDSAEQSSLKVRPWEGGVTVAGVLRPCTVPGCGLLAPRRCPRHPMGRQRRRPSPRARGYDAAWARRSKAAIAEQPWCSRCGTEGTPNNPLTGDHPVPLARGGSRDQEPAVLCRRCNSRKGVGVPLRAAVIRDRRRPPPFRV